MGAEGVIYGYIHDCIPMTFLESIIEAGKSVMGGQRTRRGSKGEG